MLPAESRGNSSTGVCMLWRACARVFVRARGGLTELNDLLYLNRRRVPNDGKMVRGQLPFSDVDVEEVQCEINE
ncbi:hypothetical protein ZWY2020_004001 [Hordeum vulgare]|nr:hypothetical protein ZWY2020_004001 [Hordeum vulgare]